MTKSTPDPGLMLLRQAHERVPIHPGPDHGLVRKEMGLWMIDQKTYALTHPNSSVVILNTLIAGGSLDQPVIKVLVH